MIPCRIRKAIVVSSFPRVNDLPQYGFLRVFAVTSMIPSCGSGLKPNQRAAGNPRIAMPLLHHWAHLFGGLVMQCGSQGSQSGTNPSASAVCRVPISTYSFLTSVTISYLLSTLAGPHLSQQ